MNNDFVSGDYKKISESDVMIVYEIKSDDRFIEFICKRYNIKLCLCIYKHRVKGHYMCMCHYDGLDIDNYMNYSTFSSRVVAFRNNNGQFLTAFVDFLNKYDSFQKMNYNSFQMSVDECIEFFKLLVVDIINKGFNILTFCYSINEDFGTIPRGSSEKEIMMKMELKGLIK